MDTHETYYRDELFDVSLDYAARLTGVSENYLRKMLDEGRLPHHEQNGETIIHLLPLQAEIKTPHKAVSCLLCTTLDSDDVYQSGGWLDPDAEYYGICPNCWYALSKLALSKSLLKALKRELKSQLILGMGELADES